jgi:hypothetical protein
MRADSWILNSLPEALVDDWFDLHIHTEFDMQVMAYHHLRVAFTDGNVRWRWRAQPRTLAGTKNTKPDLVLYKGTVQYDAIEMKCLLDGFNWQRLETDLEKLRLWKQAGLRHAYLLVLYDDETTADLGTKDEWMKSYLTFIGANVRRYPGSDRKRSRYDATRRRWETHYRQ